MINKGLLSVDPEYHGSVLCSVANKYYNDEFASPLTREDSRIHLKPRTNAFFFLVKNSVCFMVNGINAVNCYDVNFGTT